MQQSNETLEILAPAGSMESLTAAVRSGANAVYLGAERFSARGNAHNFDTESLKQAVEYCHTAGVAVHLAVNTMLFDKELSGALELIEYACKLPVDAIIVQDWGLFYLLRKAAPELPLHCSTQMSIHTPAGAKLCDDLGASRVVLSRELSLKEISEISSVTDVELEHFVHGALCMCVSGQCYFSAVLGSRSGNRGLCAQPCRLPFRAKGGTGYDLSLKDLSMITRLDALRESGVDSCKIEGRMKRPEYVAAATAACRYAADGKAIPQDLLENLESVFSRSGFTSGYPDGKLGVEMFGTRTQEDVAGATKSVFSALQKLYQKENPRVALSMDVTAKLNEPVSLTVSDNDGHTVSVTGAVVEEAVNRPLALDRWESQLKKTGGTVYFVENFHAEIDENTTVPLSSLNELRRTALEQLTEQRSHHKPLVFSKVELPTLLPHRAEPMQLRAMVSRVNSSEEIPDSFQECERVFVPLSTKEQVLHELLERNIPLGVALPRGMFGTEHKIREQLKLAKSLGITHGWTGNLGGAPLIQEADMELHGGFSLNVANTQSLEFLKNLGFCDAELSCEMTFSQAAALGGDLPRGLVVYGRLPLMLTRNCPAKNNPDGCKNCENKGGTRPAMLIDRKGVTFPIQCDGGCSTIYNSVPLVWSDQLHEIRGQDFGVLQFTVENSVEKDEIFHAYRRGKSPEIAFTRGLYRRGVE